MKRTITVAAAALLFTACNNTPEQTNTPSADTTKQDTVATTATTDSTTSTTTEAPAEEAVSTTPATKVEGAEAYIRKMNKMGVPCFIDAKDNSLHIELMENISGDYNELANYTLHEAISNGVKGITCCKVYYDRELVGTASLKKK